MIPPWLDAPCRGKHHTSTTSLRQGESCLFWWLHQLDAPCVCVYKARIETCRLVKQCSLYVSASLGHPNNNAISEKLTSPPAHQRSCASKPEEWGVTLFILYYPFRKEGQPEHASCAFSGKHQTQTTTAINGADQTRKNGKYKRDIFLHDVSKPTCPHCTFPFPPLIRVVLPSPRGQASPPEPFPPFCLSQPTSNQLAVAVDPKPTDPVCNGKPDRCPSQTQQPTQTLDRKPKPT